MRCMIVHGALLCKLVSRDEWSLLAGSLEPPAGRIPAPCRLPLEVDTAEPSVDLVQTHVVGLAGEHGPAYLRQLERLISLGDEREAAAGETPHVEEERGIAEVRPLVGGSRPLEQLRLRADAERDSVEQLSLGA